MATNNENNPLNDAVEQVSTVDTNTDQQQAQQNQQNTIATTIATGADNADASDEINQALSDSPTSAGAEQDDSNAASEQSTQSGNDGAAQQQDSQSNIVDSQDSNVSESEPQADNGAASGAGAQAVGGEQTQPDTQAGGSSTPSDAVTQAQPSVSPSVRAAQDESSDTATTEETFEVNVLSDEQFVQSQQDDAFDSETTETSFEVQVDNVNDAAVVSGMDYEIQEDGLLTFTDTDLLNSASDIDGDELFIDNVTYEGDQGVLTHLGNGNYTFAPKENFNGDISLSYGVSDGTAITTASIDVLVESVNDLPVFGTASYTVDEDNVLIFNETQLLSSASDVEGDVSLVEVNYSGNDGIFTVNNDGTCSFAPNENFNGTVTLDIIIADEDGAQVEATFDVNVLAVNDAPVSGDIAYTLDEDGNITLSQNQLLSQANDVDGDDLTATNVTVGGNASVSENPDGSFTVTPDANFNGDLNLAFDVSDGLETIQAAGTLTVNPVNDLPTTSDVSANVDEDTSITVNQAQLLANAADIDGDQLTASNLSAANATIQDNGDGTFTITPDANFNGLIDIAYDISDGSTPVAGNLALTVDPVNDAPIISADVPIAIEEDGSYTVTQAELLQFATDIENDDMTAVIGEQGESTTVSGTVLNAENGQPVVGAEVTLSDDVGNSTTAVTNAQGQYTVTGNVFEQGSVTIEQEGAITNTFLVPAGETTDSGVISLSEVLEATDMRIVVTWGATPRDMDNHLWLYDTDTGAELDHIYYRDMNHQLGDGMVQQDVDDTNGHGPETITIPNYQDANMHYSVHNYSNRSWDVDGVENVQVQVFVGDTLVQTFAPELPENISGDHWHVFDIVDGIVVPSQEVGSQNNFTLPTSEDAANADNGIDIASLFNVDEGNTDNGSDGSDNVTIGDISIPNGVITDNGDGTYTITPNADFNGEFEINYTIDDGNGGVSPAQLDVTVTAVNDAAVIYDQSFSMDEDGTLTFTDAELLQGASDIEGDDLTVTGVHYEGTEGVLTSLGNGTHTFTPNENYNGELQLTFDVSDGTDTSSAVIDIAVASVNDAPIAGSTSYSVNEEGVIDITVEQLLANSSDVDGEAISLDSVTYSGSDGILALHENGTYYFSPNENFDGEVVLQVVVSDESGLTSPTTATIDVLSVNDTPAVSGPIAYQVNEDNSITLSQEQLLIHASDVDGDQLSAENLYLEAFGTVTDDGNGNFTITPAENFHGPLSLTFDVTDGQETVATALNLTVDPVNDLVIARDDVNLSSAEPMIRLDVAPEHGAVQYLDENGDWADMVIGLEYPADTEVQFVPNTVEIQSDTRDIRVGSFDNDPNSQGFDGTASTSDWGNVDGDTATYVEDGIVVTTVVSEGALAAWNGPNSHVGAGIGNQSSNGLSDDETLTVTIEGEDVNQITFQLDGLGGYFDETSSHATQVNITAYDAEGNIISTQGGYRESGEYEDTYSFTTDVPVHHFELGTTGGNGTYVVQNMVVSRTMAEEIQITTIQGDGSEVTNTLQLNLNHSTAEDTLNVTEQLIEIDGTITSRAIEVEEDGVLTLQASDLLVNDSDIDGDELTLVSVTSTDDSHGTVSLDENGQIQFTPDANYNGQASFEYTVTDGNGSFDTATVFVNVTPVNDGPVATDLPFTIQEDGTLLFTNDDILSATSDIDNDDLSIEQVTYDGTSGVLDSHGDGTYTFTPNENFHGDLELSYSVTDGLESSSANINVTVESVNDLPVFGTASYTVDEDNVLIFNETQLLSSASDVEGDVSLVEVSYSGNDGIFTVNNDGTCSFAPNENFNGTVTLDIVIADEDGAQVEATFDVNVLAVNDAPVSGDIAYTLDEDGNITLSQNQLLSQANDVDGDDLTATNVTVGGNASVSENPDGSFTVTPDANFNGDLNLSFDVSDGLETIQAAGTLTVNPVNDLPTTSDVSANVDEDTSITVNQVQLLANAADIDGDQLTASNLSAANASIQDNGDGTFTITPDANFNGLIDIAYDISDGSTPVAGNLALTVDPVNDAPIISADVPITIEEDGSYTVTQAELLQFATDIENDDMTAVIGEQGESTTVSGTVLNAENGQPVVGAEVTLSDDVGNSTTAVTNSQGQYTVTGNVFEQGSVTIEQEGAITNTFLVPAGETTDSGVISLSEVLEATDMRIVVTWGATPRDMDNHLWLYDTDTGAELDHIYYRDMNHQLGDGMVQQDVDDTNGHGPETITIPNYQDANMHYSVHNYSNRSWDVDGVENVQVQVFVGDTLVQTFAPELPENISGDHWHVFDIVDGIVVPSQEVGSQNNFTLPTSEDAANADNGIDIASLFNVDEGNTDNGSDGSDNVTIGDISIPNGVITDNGDGTYTITPNADFDGEFEINYTVDDGNGGVSPAQLDVTVTAVNDAAVIYDQSFSMDEDGTLTFTDAELLQGASDIEGDDLTVTGIHYEGTDGVLTSLGNGTHTFTPNENYNGALNLSFDVSDGTDTSSASIAIAVAAINDAPDTTQVDLNVDEDNTITITREQLLESVTDIDSTELHITDVSYSGNDGVLVENSDGSFSFTPSNDFNGEIPLTYTASDGELTATETISLTVNAVADDPQLNVTDELGAEIGVDGLKVDPDNIVELNVSAQVTDLDGSESVTVQASGIPEGSVLRYDSQTVLDDQDNGLTSYVDSEITVTFEGEGAGYYNAVGYYKVDQNGQINDVEIVYENASQVGGGGDLVPGQSAFSFDLEEGESFNLFVVPNGFNHNNFSSFSDGHYEFQDVNGGLATTDSIDPQLVFVSSNGGETVIRSQNGDAIFHGGTSPNLNQDNINHTRTYFNNENELVYGIEDMYNGGDRDFDDFLFTIDLGEVNTSIYQGEVNIDSSEPITLPTVALLEPISIELPVDYSGEFDLNIEATSTEQSNGDTSTTSQTIHIDAREHAPESTPVSATMQEDGSLLVSQEMLLANAVDLNNDALTAFELATNDENAIIADNNDGTFTITLNDDFNGDLELSYKITDGEFVTPNTLNLSVEAVNDAPISESVELSGVEDESIVISQEDLLAYASDVDGDTLTAKDLQIDASFGSLVDNLDGTWTFSPVENFNGDVPFTFKVDDGQLDTEASGHLNLLEVNDAPDAPAISLSTDEDQILVIDPAYILAQASDVDGDTLTLDQLSVRAPENATLQVQPDGMYHLITSQDFNGLIELDYAVSDDALEAQGTVSIDVIPVNDEPFAVGNASLTTNEDGAFTFDASDLVDLFDDIDTDELVVSRVIVPDSEDGGEIAQNEDGTWTFSPTADFAGISELQVIVSDGEFETSLDVPVYIRPVADGAVITTAHDGPLVFSEDTTGYLNLDVSLVDSSELLSQLVMTGYPVGFQITDGTHTVVIEEAGQQIVITDWDINNLQMTPPQDFHGSFFVTVSATTVDYGDETTSQDDSVFAGDVNVISGNELTISTDELINLAQNVEAEQGDAVRLVHLVDNTQGELVTNSDGTWTFIPASDFYGNVDLAYIIEKDGIIHDEQLSIGVYESGSSLPNTLEIDGIGQADVTPSETLYFSDSDMLATISSDDHQDLSIESVSLLGGEGIIESDGQGGYQFTPAEGYSGPAQIGFVASDGDNSVQSHFNVGVEESSADSGLLVQSADSSIEISESHLLQNLGLTDESDVTALAYTGDSGALISTGEDSWTFWPDDTFDGDISLATTITTNGDEQNIPLNLSVEAMEASEQQTTVLETVVPDNTETDDSFDVTVAPGDVINLETPEAASSSNEVDHIVVTGLPNDAEVTGGLDNGDGSYTISGDLTQPLTVSFSDAFEGQVDVNYQGVDELDAPIEGASETLQIDVSEQYALQSTQSGQTVSTEQQQGTDWTQSDNTQVNVDFTDDSGSFDTDDNTGGGAQQDLDDNLM
ncbi:tandem-95 repeat protein [Vibrio mediterranei]|uniref:Tandem-95 repeat protein n=1 Tax=Vibrio mediterranei TaxID=689 RepID=A0A3G4V5L8_9VIBR|nr:tandem-95 repeat protein [Vibrio mediterranei]AYV19805.1 tandem-95 repeat protein [Vibrio mediterranei]